MALQNPLGAMMHPARQAYVEEDDPEVSIPLRVRPVSIVHMVVQRNAGLLLGDSE